MNTTSWQKRALQAMTVAAVLYWSLAIHQAFFSHPYRILGMAGFTVDLRDGGLVVIQVQKTDRQGSPGLGHQAGLQVGDRLQVLVDGRGGRWPLDGFLPFSRALRSLRLGEEWVLEVQRPLEGKAAAPVRVVLPAVTRADLFSAERTFNTILIYITPLLALAAAFIIGYAKPEDRIAFLASGMFICMANLVGVGSLLYPAGLREFAQIYAIVSGSLLVYLFLRFFLLFPSPSIIERKLPWLKRVFLAVALAEMAGALAATAFAWHSYAAQTRFQPVQRFFEPVLNWATLLMALTALASLVLNTVQARSKDERRRLLIILVGALTAVLSLLGYILFGMITGTYPLGLVITVVLLLACFPAAFIYAIVKHRVMGIRLILRRGIQYALVSKGFLLIEAVALFVVVGWVLGPSVERLLPGVRREALAVLLFFLVALMALGIRRINKRILPAIDRLFFRDAYNAQQVLSDLSRAVRQVATQPAALVQMVAEKISDSLYPDKVAIFLDPSALEPAPVGRPGPGGFRCFYRCVRPGNREPNGTIGGPCQELYLPDHSVTAKAVSAISPENPEPLDVYLDDPRSWAGGLVRREDPDDPAASERRLLERLNARLLVPLATREGILGFASLGEKLSEEPYTREDKQLLLTVAEQTAQALDYAHLIREVADQERLKRDIEIAKEVQQQMLPQALPRVATLEFTGTCLPARGVGGDYYDFISLPGGKLGIALGDISGKGVFAAMLMSSLHAMMHSNALKYGDRAAALMEDINRLMLDATQGQRFATFFYGVFDEATRDLTYVNAGHNYPMLFRPRERSAGKGSEILQGFELTRLEEGGTVLGFLAEAAYRQATVRLAPDDLLVIFSDGITEAKNEGDEEYGEERLAACAATGLGRAPADLMDHILRDVEAFSGPTPQYDDITLVVARVR
jgi:sigma-B regulation protein RsbU (phosphoserine phosphatase)